MLINTSLNLEPGLRLFRYGFVASMEDGHGGSMGEGRVRVGVLGLTHFCLSASSFAFSFFFFPNQQHCLESFTIMPLSNS